MPSRAKTLSLAALAIVALLGASGAYGAYEYKHRESIRTEVMALTGGDPDLGPGLAIRYGCAGCHEIPGVRGPRGRVGPPLRHIAGRVYIGGVLINRPENLVRWIVNPRAVSPKTAMPVTGISGTEARHVAAYLLTLR